MQKLSADNTSRTGDVFEALYIFKIAFKNTIKSVKKLVSRSGLTFFEAWLLYYKTFFILNSAEHEIDSAQIVKMTTIVGILTFISRINTTSERLKATYFFICLYFSFYEQLKFRAQLS